MISEEDYAKRDDSFRNFKQNMLAKNPHFMNNQNESVYVDFMKDEADKFVVG